jgi:hypothetical protein
MDSKYLLEGVTKNSQKWEDKGWLGIKNKELIKTITAWIRYRTAPTAFQWVKGHSGEQGNEEADKLAAEGAHLPQVDEIDLTAPPSQLHSGAKLSALTQSDIYEYIMSAPLQPIRLSTTAMLDVTRWAVKGVDNNLPTDIDIWRSIQNKDLTRTVRVFIWKCLHNAHKIGKFWEKIPEHEHRSNCPTCGTEESMEHLLLECNAPGQKESWEVAKSVWQQLHINWPELTYGTILGACMIKFKGNKNEGGISRLYRIIVTETAHFIWKLRCERRIGNGDDPEKFHSTSEIKNRWLSMINLRLTHDRLMADRNRYGKKALKTGVVLNTWPHVLLNVESLPRNWIWQSGVLVGIRPRRPPGRNR